MCIIAIRPQGVGMDEQSEHWLENCALTNDDGAGMMYADGNNVYWHKGFMGDAAIDRMIDYARNIPKEYPMVLHYRIATHGCINPETTHPFPLYKGDDSLTHLIGASQAALVHNGIIQQMPYHINYSDTQQLVRYINEMPELGTDYLLNVLNMVGGGLYALMTPNKVHTVGEFIEDNGWLFSNHDYRYDY